MKNSWTRQSKASGCLYMKTESSKNANLLKIFLCWSKAESRLGDQHELTFRKWKCLSMFNVHERIVFSTTDGRTDIKSTRRSTKCMLWERTGIPIHIPFSNTGDNWRCFNFKFSITGNFCSSVSFTSVATFPWGHFLENLFLLFWKFRICTKVPCRLHRLL